MLLDLAGFVEAAEFEDAGGFELAAAGAAAPEFALEGVDAAADVFVSAALVDFDFFVLADFVPASASFEAAVSVEEAFDFFELVDFVPAAESDEAVESALASVEEAFADFDFFELVDFVSEAESAGAVASPEDDLADLDFLAPVEAVELPEASLSEVDFAFVVFDVEDFPEEEASLESVELASVDFFFDLVVFFAGVALESLESVACAFTGAALASASPSPAEIKNANTYFLNRFMLFPPQFARFRRTPKRRATTRFYACTMRLALRERDFRVTSWTSLLISCLPNISALPPRFVLAACRVMPPWLKSQRLSERPPRLERSQRKWLDNVLNEHSG